MTMPSPRLRACLAVVFSVGLTTAALAQAGSGGAVPPGGASGTAPSGAARSLPSSSGPGTTVPGASRLAVAPKGEFPGNPRLDASSRKLDRQIRRGICTGC